VPVLLFKLVYKTKYIDIKRIRYAETCISPVRELNTLSVVHFFFFTLSNVGASSSCFFCWAPPATHSHPLPHSLPLAEPIKEMPSLHASFYMVPLPFKKKQTNQSNPPLVLPDEQNRKNF